MKFKYALILCVLYVLSASPVYAEYYKWIDDNGVQHYTDDLSEVPENQRKGLDVYKSVKSSEKKERKEQAESSITQESLVIKKDMLDKEYKGLIKRKQELTEQKETLGTEKHNKLAKKLNIDIQEYQKRVKNYDSLVDRYNSKAQTSPQKTKSE